MHDGPTQADELVLRFYELADPGSHWVAAAALAQALDALQRLVHLTGMRLEGRIPGRRIRPSADIQSRYRLVCDIPREGSYISPVRMLGHGLLSPAESERVLSAVAIVLEAVGKQDEQEVVRVLPDETWRRFSLDAIERLAPPQATGTELLVQRGHSTIIDTAKVRNFIEKLARNSAKLAAREAVVGQFKRIDFVARQITIRHVATARDLTCTYDASVEESLLDHPRDTLLVFGTVTRDAAGRPESIEDVDHIEAVDIDPIRISDVPVMNQHIEPLEDLAAAVEFEEVDAVYTAKIPSLDVNVFAETRDELEDALASELALLWKRYATVQDDKLTPAARGLKRRMLESFRTVADAPQTS
jgi:hypothetical protein